MNFLEYMILKYFIQLSQLFTQIWSVRLASYHFDFNLVNIIEELQDLQSCGGFHLQGGFIRKKGKIVVGPDE